jgi:hypothetical protein
LFGFAGYRGLAAAEGGRCQVQPSASRDGVGERVGGPEEGHIRNVMEGDLEAARTANVMEGVLGKVRTENETLAVARTSEKGEALAVDRRNRCGETSWLIVNRRCPLDGVDVRTWQLEGKGNRSC